MKMLTQLNGSLAPLQLERSMTQVLLGQKLFSSPYKKIPHRKNINLICICSTNTLQQRLFYMTIPHRKCQLVIYLVLFHYYFSFLFSYYIKIIIFLFMSRGKLVFIFFYQVYLNSNGVVSIFKSVQNKKLQIFFFFESFWISQEEY